MAAGKCIALIDFSLHIQAASAGGRRWLLAPGWWLPASGSGIQAAGLGMHVYHFRLPQAQRCSGQWCSDCSTVAATLPIVTMEQLHFWPAHTLGERGRHSGWPRWGVGMAKRTTCFTFPSHMQLDSVSLRPHPHLAWPGPITTHHPPPCFWAADLAMSMWTTSL